MSVTPNTEYHVEWQGVQKNGVLESGSRHRVPLCRIGAVISHFQAWSDACNMTGFTVVVTPMERKG